MPGFLLNHSSIIMCPHGGTVTHIPVTVTSYRIKGQLPMLLGDVYQVAGCPNDTPGMGSCLMVTWVAPSVNLIIKGQPALINTSVGICQSIGGIPAGPAIVGVHSLEMEPDTLTIVND